MTTGSWREHLVGAATGRLRAAGVASPAVDAELLLVHVLGTTRTALLVAPEPTAAQRAAFDDLVARRARRVPLQHLTGTQPFRHVDLSVGPGVFVPRPETEALAGWAIDHLRMLESPIAVDLGTGSGAIAAAMADEVPHTRVHAVELGEAAFGYAVQNLRGAGVDVRHGDMADAFADLDGQVDVVVANPPYIPLTAWEGVEAEVRDHDPDLALWSGRDGLDATAVVESTAARLLVAGGVVASEHADAQGTSAPAVFAATGRWADVRDHRDLAGRPRFVTARRI